MRSLVSFWHNEHVRFARLLDFLEGQITSFGAGNHPDYELMRDVLHYLQHFGDHYHHPREDEAFARLLEYEPTLEPMINRLLQEHRVMAVAGARLREYVEDILQDNWIERAKVEAAAATYLVYYRHHLNTEEKEILPRAAQMLRPEDWEAIAQKVPRAPDPLFGDQIEMRYKRLYEEIRDLHPEANTDGDRPESFQGG